MERRWRERSKEEEGRKGRREREAFKKREKQI